MARLGEDFLEQILFFLLAEDDDDAIILQLLPELFPDNVDTTYDPNVPRFSLEQFSDVQCKAFFRFYKQDLISLANSLRIPDEITLSNRIRINGIDALCITLRRLSYPNRLVDLEKFCGWPKTTLSMIINFVIDHIHHHFADKITNLNQDWLVDRMQMYADAIYNKGSPLTNIFGFIDGTVRPVCRPTIYQRIVYNGHKRVHALKFQSISTPDGLICNLWGPMEGRRHDCALLAGSGIMDQFEAGDWRDRDGLAFALYGDPAYPVREYLLSPYKGNPDENQRLFNTRMSKVREAVEWEFGKIIQQFAFLDFKKNLKIFLQPVAKYYLVGGILTNCHTCLYGSQSSQYFDCEPPTLAEYLN